MRIGDQLTKSIVVPDEKNDWKLATRFANLALKAGYRVEWALESAPRIGSVGSYLVTLDSTDIAASRKKSNLSEEFLETLAEKLGVEVELLEGPIKSKKAVLRSARVGLFADAGSPFPFASVLSESGFDFEPISSDEIRKGYLSDFDVLLIPGGGDQGPPKQSESLGKAGREKVREFLRSGGNVWGSCAGCCNLILYSGKENPWSANYEDWKKLQSLEVINSDYWSSGMSGVGKLVVSNLSGDHPIMFGMPDQFEMTWHLGPFLSPASRRHHVTLASKAIPLVGLKGFTRAWSAAEYLNTPRKQARSLETTYTGLAIQSHRYGLMVGSYGRGNVVACGGHPEFGLDPLLEKWSLPARMISNFLFWATSNEEENSSDTSARRRAASQIKIRSELASIKKLTIELDSDIDALIQKSIRFPRPVWLKDEYAASTFGQSATRKWPLILRRIAELPVEIRKETDELTETMERLDSKKSGQERMLKIWKCVTYSPNPEQDYGWQGVLELLSSGSRKVRESVKNYEMDPKSAPEKSPYDLIWDYYLGALYDLMNARTLLKARNRLARDSMLLA